MFLIFVNRCKRIGTVSAATESAIGFSFTVKTLFGPSVGVGSFPRDVATSCVDAFWKMPHKGKHPFVDFCNRYKCC